MFIVRDDVKFLALADPFAQLVGFADIFGGTGGLSQIAVVRPQPRVGHSKIEV